MTIPAHAQRSIDRAAAYIKDKPNFQAFIAAFTGSVFDLETMFAGLKVAFVIDTATGAQLDAVGEIVQQPRDGRTDALYRMALRARVLANKASGTAEELYNIVRTVVPSATCALTPYPPASFVLQVFDYAFTADEWAQLDSFFSEAVAAGVNGTLQGMFGSRATSFTLDGTSAQALDTGLLSGITF
jgi:hypothetical protein